MARVVYTQDLGNGTALQVLDDGSTVVYDITTRQQLGQTRPNGNLQNVIAYGSPDDVRAAMARSDEIGRIVEQSEWGRREREARQADIDRYNQNRDDRNSQFDRNFGLQEDQLDYRREYDDRSLDFQEQEAERRFELDERRFGLDERRFGLDTQRFQLDQGRFGADLLRTDLEFRSTPASWLKLADWEYGLGQSGSAPYALQAIAAGKLPASSFNTRAGTPGVVGAAGVAQGLNTGQYGAANAGAAPAGGGTPAAATSVAGPNAAYVAPPQAGGAKNPTQNDARMAAVQAILKTAGPPSDHPGISDQDAATLDLISRMYSAGAHRVTNQWGGLSADTKAIVRGGIEGVGGSPRAWDEQLAASRWRPGSISAA